jgi:hypothetical protein
MKLTCNLSLVTRLRMRGVIPPETSRGQQTKRRLVGRGNYCSIANFQKEIPAIFLGIFGILGEYLNNLYI